MAYNYSKFSKGIDDGFNDISCDKKIKKAVEARDSIQALVKKSFKVTLNDIPLDLESSGCGTELYKHLNTVDNNLSVLVDNAIEYTDYFVKYIKEENNPTVLSLVIYAFGGLFTFLSCIWFIFKSPDILQVFLRIFSSIIISVLSAAVGYFIDITANQWLLTDSIHRSKTKYLEALAKIQNSSNLIIEELELLSIDTKLLTDNLSDLSTASEELFKN